MMRILTDTTSDISLLQAKKLNIDMVSLKVIFKETVYEDQRTLEVQEFYQKMEKSDVLPTTSQPSPQDFLVYFEEVKAKNEEMIVIVLSSALSGTYQSAMIAKDMCEYEKIYIIDSMTTTLGLQALVHIAVQLNQEGKSAAEIVTTIEALKHKVRLVALVDTLDNLIRGGRLSKGAGFAGTLLKVKPLLSLQQGKLDVFSKARGTHKAMQGLMQEIEKQGGINIDYPVYFGYTGLKNPLTPFVQLVKETYPFEVSYQSCIGPVIGVHAGSGAFGIAYFTK